LRNKTKGCAKVLGNALMNDAWFCQTCDRAKTRQASHAVHASGSILMISMNRANMKMTL
jgi:hypothetical protein